MHECRQRQVDELDALSAIFGKSFLMTEGETEDLELLRVAVGSCADPGDFSGNGMPSSLSFAVEYGGDEEEIAHKVYFVLPLSYPRAACAARIDWELGRRGDNGYLSSSIQQYADSMAGEECCMQLVKVIDLG